MLRQAVLDGFTSPVMESLLQVDSLGIATVFDPWSYVLIMTSVLVVSLVILVIIIVRSLYPVRYSQTILYVVASFFQETYPRSKLPKEGFKVRYSCFSLSDEGLPRWC